MNHVDSDVKSPKSVPRLNVTMATWKALAEVAPTERERALNAKLVLKWYSRLCWKDTIEVGRDDDPLRVREVILGNWEKIEKLCILSNISLAPYAVRQAKACEKGKLKDEACRFYELAGRLFTRQLIENPRDPRRPEIALKAAVCLERHADLLQRYRTFGAATKWYIRAALILKRMVPELSSTAGAHHSLLGNCLRKAVHCGSQTGTLGTPASPSDLRWSASRLAELNGSAA